MKRALLAALVGALALPAAAPTLAVAQAQAPARVDARAAANDIATLIEENFYNEARGREIAAELRTRANSGGFDRFTNPLDLATAFTALLHPYDGHFNVSYRPGDSGPAPSGGPPSPEQQRTFFERQQAAAARANFGFRRVEMLPGGVGYIMIDQFAGIDARDANDPAKQAADAAMDLVANARAVILDLRDSRGGSPAMVAYIASHFVAADADIFNTFHSRRGTRTEAPVAEPAGGRRLDAPLYVLVNGASGSASESLPYTLQAARRATIVGEITDGRANPGGFYPTPQGFAVFISSGTPVNPITGRNWEGTGVIPDVQTPSAEALSRAHILALQQLTDLDPQSDAAAESRAALEALTAETRTLSARALGAYVGDYGERDVELVDGQLRMRVGRRPPAVLRAIGEDVFVNDANPMGRVRFERDGRGQVVAFETSGPNAPTARFLKM
ncbi:carboxyl-terminal protease [alpha proteobacterium U9-1i]|nr:carboxyl-terminal protease [alpha proteobacterium U9-1i]